MKLFLLITCIITLLTSGCVVHEHDDYRHDHYRRHHHRSEVIVAPPSIEVRPPEVIVR
jgi:hypothetical protein